MYSADSVHARNPADTRNPKEVTTNAYLGMALSELALRAQEQIMRLAPALDPKHEREPSDRGWDR